MISASLRRLSLLLLTPVLFFLAPAFPSLADSPPAPDYAIQNGWFYTEANGKGGGPGQPGFAITNDASIPFFTTFSQGGVQKFGYPASQRFAYAGFTNQIMQKAVFQSQGGTVSFLNTMDVLHTAGKDSWLQATYQTPPPEDTAPDTGLTFPQIQARHDAFLDSNPQLKAAYFAVPDPLSLYGLPLTHPTPEFNGQALVIRTQRAVLQLWLVDMPWAKAHTVSVANGGDIFKASGLVAQTYLTPIANVPPGAAVPPPPVLTPIQLATAVLLTQADVPAGFSPDSKGIQTSGNAVYQNFFKGTPPNASAFIVDQAEVVKDAGTAQAMVTGVTPPDVATDFLSDPKTIVGVNANGPVPNLGQASNSFSLEISTSDGAQVQVFRVIFAEQNYAILVDVGGIPNAESMSVAVALAHTIDSRIPH